MQSYRFENLNKYQNGNFSSLGTVTLTIDARTTSVVYFWLYIWSLVIVPSFGSGNSKLSKAIFKNTSFWFNSQPGCARTSSGTYVVRRCHSYHRKWWVATRFLFQEWGTKQLCGEPSNQERRHRELRVMAFGCFVWDPPPPCSGLYTYPVLHSLLRSFYICTKKKKRKKRQKNFFGLCKNPPFWDGQARALVQLQDISLWNRRSFK